MNQKQIKKEYKYYLKDIIRGSDVVYHLNEPVLPEWFKVPVTKRQHRVNADGSIKYKQEFEKAVNGLNPKDDYSWLKTSGLGIFNRIKNKRSHKSDPFYHDIRIGLFRDTDKKPNQHTPAFPTAFWYGNDDVTVTVRIRYRNERGELMEVKDLIPEIHVYITDVSRPEIAV